MKKNLKASVRLSPHVIPAKYKIHFFPDLEEFTFTGVEEILLDIKKPTKEIILHSAEIEILTVELVQNKNKQVGKVTYKEKDEQVVFQFDSSIKSGKAKLKIAFTGILNDKMRGFYRSSYEHNGKTYHMGVTQFESTDARRAFPCFDEPAHKAIFEVSFKIPEDRTVISNTIESEIPEHASGYKIVKFIPSPKMSSYLLAFIIGHFEKIERKTQDGVAVRIFVNPGKTKQAEFALDVAVKCLEFYTNYFKIKYPLPTMDLIAIPDFAAGAMENWGAVTYRETALLVDPENSSTHNKQWVALVIAHELAHQWFGNLVTMEWWTHLWLNEGFASYMEYVAVDNLFPKWHVWTQFVFADHSTALNLDGLKNTHSIEIDVNHPAEISEIFDEVSYSKGASVIRMLAEYLGEVNFRNGLRAYLKKHSYANANTNHLWESLEKISKKPVFKMMQNWTRMPGYPLVSVQTKNNKLELAQQRFFSSVLSQQTKDDTKWLVPISVVSNLRTEQALLSGKPTFIKYFSNNNNWVKLNKNETAFIRVRYSKKLLTLLEKPVFEKQLGEVDRFGIIRDAFVLAEAGHTSTDQSLSFAGAYKNDKSYIVWAEIATHVVELTNLLYDEPYYKEFEKYVVNLFGPIGKRVGWNKKKGESHEAALLRSVVLGTLGKHGDIEVLNNARALFRKKNIEPDLRGVVYTLVAQNGGKKEYDYFMEWYKKEKFQEEKDRILRAICSFKDKKLIQNTLEFAFSDQVKAQDSFKVVSFLCANPEGRDFAWKKVQTEWGSIVKKFGGGHLFTRFVKPLSNFTREEDVLEIEKFFKTHESEGLARTIQQVLEQIRSNAAWLSRDKEKIKHFLEK